MGKHLFLLLFLFNITSLYSLDFHRSSEAVVIKNGLNNTIYDICHGRDGFMWLSTDRGITRYDGFRFRNYPLITRIDSLSVPLSQAVRTIKETSGDLLYVQLYQGGIVCFDKAKEKYLSFSFNSPFNLRDVLDFCWSDSTLYLATSKGLFKSQVVRKKEKKEEFLFCVLDAEPLIEGRITNLCTDGKADLYLVVDRRKLIHYNLADRKVDLIKEYDGINRLFLENGYLWIGRLWNDIVCYDLKRAKERIISIGDMNDVDFSNPYITDLTCRDEHTFYLTTWDGLFRVRFDNENLCESHFTLVPLTQYEETYLSNIERKMTSVFWDKKQDILWLGTFGGGIVKFDVSDDMYSRIQQDFNSRINGIVEDVKGYVWLVMTDGVLMKSTVPSLSPNIHFELWKKSSGFSGHCPIYEDRNGYIWVGNNSGEVMRINPVTDEMETFHLKTKEGEKLVAAIYQFCMDSRNRLWVATSTGLIQVDPGSYKCQKLDSTDGIAEIVYSVVEDKEGNIWVGTNKGLKRLENIGNEIVWKEHYEKENGLEETSVRQLYVNNSNQIYVAYLNIVARIDGRNKDKFDSIYTLQSGLTNGHVSCMIDDQLGNTWAGNNAGIMTIRNGQEAFYNYLSVGNYNAVCRLSSGQLLWADSWGLLFFDPAVLKAGGENKQLILTDIEINGETVLAGELRNGQMVLSVSPEKQKELILDSENNNFCLHFSDLRYGMLQRKIAYRLLPEDEEWKMQPLGDGIWYNRLPAGQYTLQVKLVFPDAREGEIIQIPILIKAKWYYTTWAYWGYALFIIIVSYLLYLYFAKKSVRKRVHHDREMLLRENLNLEKVKREQKQEMEVMKNRLLMTFVQELRTPLSLIIAPLKEMLEDKTQISNFAVRGRMAYRNSLRMQDACNQLLAIYGNGDLNDKLKVASYHVEKLININLFDIREFLKVYPIHFQYEKRIKKDLVFYVDRKKVEFIIHNLLTNAFTHTNYSGNVSLVVCETVQEQLHYVSIIIEDDGKKMAQSIGQPTGKNDMSADGLDLAETGFSVMQRMTEMHHGRIFLESSQEKGTKAMVSFPLDKTILEDDPAILFVEPENTADITSEQLELSQLGLPPEDNAMSTSTGLKKTLLIVEDQKDIRLYLKVLFGKEYNLLMATNGQEGIDMAVKELPDLILCDVMMPVKDGFECCRELKEGLDTCSIPFIMLTARVEDEDVIRGLELGADDYVLKPFTPSILKAKVHNLINSRQALKQMYTKLFMLPGMDSTDVAETERGEDAGKAEDPFISSVIKIVEENICKADFSVKKLASEMNMSQPTLYRKVKQSTDYTIIELIRGVRMRRAGVLLKTKQYAVQEVAEMVGYNDIPTFRKHFVDAFGTTPSTYE